MIQDKKLAEQYSYSTNRGYWALDGNFFFSRAECLRYASEIKRSDITYHYFDSVWETMDWSNEPVESLKELYKQRAQQLRDKYDYLVLWFSGGSDSTGILNAFVENNIKLDEVVTHYPLSIIEKKIVDFDPNNRDEKNVIFEYTMVAKPRLQELAKTNPEIKITVVDSTESNINMTKRGELHKLFLGGIAASPSNSGQYKLTEINRDRLKNGSVGVLVGIDKPRIVYNTDTKKFGTYFLDTTINYFGNFEEDFGVHFEPFYYAHELPKLHQKRCFVIKNNLRQYLSQSEFRDSQIAKVFGNLIYFDANHDIFKKILYEWDTSIWQTDKTKSFYYNGFSSWVFDPNIVSVNMEDYREGQLKELLHGIDPRFITYNQGRINNLQFFNTSTIWF